ncbi:thioredoxin H2-like [Capsicum annuum]|uniref:thioredoxin H2-like n=1 Tax=Capsicum annuum TaxID=4072 RepID=UPI0007BF1927|nr:thioredoxin H2-like [Capsicum annuum]
MVEETEMNENLCAMITECNLVGNPNEWWFYSRATRHVCADKEAFSTYHIVGPKEVIFLGNTARAKVEGKNGANNSSSWHQTNALSATAPMKTQVIHFHSSATWKLHFDSLKETNKLIVTDFTASWCGPCRHMEPIINNFAATYTAVEFIKIEVDELADIAQKYGVQAMPTFLLINQGKLVDKLVGGDKVGLQNMIEINRA